MNIKEFIEQHKGREVELFLPPDMPGVSGTLLSCEDDFLVLEDSVWSYKAVLGVRPVKKLGRPLQVVAPVSHVSSVPSDSSASVDVQKSEAVVLAVGFGGRGKLAVCQLCTDAGVCDRDNERILFP